MKDKSPDSITVKILGVIEASASGRIGIAALFVIVMVLVVIQFRV